ncbi:MAG: hypothetical protein GXO48_02950 [Chlorobi bacterium]|nr:hypothetical protein [Chlorobiota bacterium]
MSEGQTDNTGGSTWRRGITIAGLMHDIGKVGQRAEKPQSNELSKKYAQSELAPVYNEAPAYTHVWWTAWWIEKWEKFYRGLHSYGSGDFSLLRVSARHHLNWNTLNLLERIVVLADHISAGMERTGTGEDNEEFVLSKRGLSQDKLQDKSLHKNLPILSIWSEINVKAWEGCSNRNGKQVTIRCNPYFDQYWGYDLKSLNIHNALFPQRITDKDVGQLANVEKYKKIWEGLQGEHEDLTTWLIQQGKNFDENTFRAYVDTLLSLFHKYLWAVPSGTYNDGSPIISLFDHLKLTSAFAHCLYEWLEEDLDNRWKLIGGEHPVKGFPSERPSSSDEALKQISRERPFLLVGGDLQGIQNFIYNIYSSKAKKSLKGRSFYLQLLTEVIIEEILRHPDIQAYRTHVLFASGGRFYLILPNTQKVKDALQGIYRKLQCWLWNKLKGDIYVGLTWVPFGFYSDGQRRTIVLDSEDEQLLKELKQGVGSHPMAGCDGYVQSFTDYTTLGDLWWVLAEKLNKLKTRRWKDLLTQISNIGKDCPDVSFDRIFEKSEEGGSLGSDDEKTAKEICRVTGRLGIPGKDLVKIKDDEGEDAYVIDYVNDQIELGKELANMPEYIVLRRKRGGQSHQDAVIEIYGWDIILVGGKSNSKDIRDIQFLSGDIVWKLNDPENFLDILTNQNKPDVPVSIGFYFYGGYRQPIKKDRPATFLELSAVSEDELKQISETIRECLKEVSSEENSERYKQFKNCFSLEPLKACFDIYELCDSESEQIPTLNPEDAWEIDKDIEDPLTKGVSVDFETTYLAILKADVDRLGEIFVYGLPPDKQSFSALSMISWQLNWFFAGFINTLHASNDLYRKHIQIVYAGGDDLFLVGRWDAVLSFAVCLRYWFWLFVARRTDVSISAGLQMFKPKFPIQRAAQKTGESEKIAKKFLHWWSGGTKPFKTKDAICIGDMALGWSPCPDKFDYTELNEIDFVLDLAGWMVYLLIKEEISFRFLYKFIQYIEYLEDNDALAYQKGCSGQGAESSFLITKDTHLKWLWRFVYDSARFKKKPTDDAPEPEVNKFIDYLMQLFWTGDTKRKIHRQRALILVAQAVVITLLIRRTFKFDAVQV